MSQATPTILEDKVFDRETQERLRIMNAAAAAAAAENRALGIPEFFDRDGVLTFRYPDGRETTEWPVEALGPDPRSSASQTHISED